MLFHGAMIFLSKKTVVCVLKNGTLLLRHEDDLILGEQRLY